MSRAVAPALVTLSIAALAARAGAGEAAPVGDYKVERVDRSLAVTKEEADRIKQRIEAAGRQAEIR